MLDQRLKKYLEEKYYDEIYDSINKVSGERNKIEDFEIAYLSVYDQYELDFVGQLNVNVYVKNEEFSNSNQKPWTYTIGFNGTMVNNEIKCWGFIANRDEGILCKKEKYMYSSFLPRIEEDEYEKVAYDFLDKYFPEYKSGQAIDIDIVLKRMGLKIECVKLSTNSNVLGILCVNDCNIKYYDKSCKDFKSKKADAGTIFIDEDAHLFFTRGEYSKRYTIIHECVHWFIHRKYFMFERIFSETEGKAIVCGIDGTIKNLNNLNDIKWIERQANQIATRILLPRDNAMNQFLKIYRNCDNEYSYNRLSSAVEKLSEYFNVSKMVIKNRLAALGNDELTGIFEYIDDSYVDSYYYKRLENKNISFSIGCLDFSTEYALNLEFRKMLEDGKYLYVDKHLCLNSEKYIMDTMFGKKLTPYAREHIEECCLPFEYRFSIPNNSFEIKEYAFCRKNMLSESVQMEVKYYGEKNTITDASNDLFLGVVAEVQKELLDLPGGFKETLKRLMKNRELTFEELAGKSDVNEKTIRRIVNGETDNPDIGTIIALCIGMRLHPRLSFNLIEKGNYNLKAINEENIIYGEILRTMYNCDLEDVNEFLSNHNLKKIP